MPHLSPAQLREFQTRISTPLTSAHIPKLVCLCGSTRFKEEFVQANFRETLIGNMVLTIGCDLKTDAELFGELTNDEFERIKTNLDILHLWKIWQADEVLFLNKGGYIGLSTTRELYVTFMLNRRIRFLEPDKKETAYKLMDSYARGMAVTDPILKQFFAKLMRYDAQINDYQRTYIADYLTEQYDKIKEIRPNDFDRPPASDLDGTRPSTS